MTSRCGYHHRPACQLDFYPDEKMPFAIVDGLRIHYQGNPDRKQGKTLLFIHGASGNLNIWREQLAFFSEGHTPIAIDLPGHGDSQGEGADDIGGYRESVKVFVDQFSIHRFIPCGHSMGGAIALDFTLHYPHMVEALVLVGSGARFGLSPELLQAFKEDPFSWSEAARSWVFSRKTPLSVVEALEAETLKTGPDVALRDMKACAGFDASARLADIKVPTLLIYGAEDHLMSQAEELLSAIPDCRLEVIDDAAHVPTAEQPAMVNAAIERFIGGVA